MAVVLGGVPVVGLVGYGLTFIKDKYSCLQELPGKVRKVTTAVKTNKIARIFAGIFTFGLTELMNHSQETVKYFYEDDFIGSTETEAAETLNEKGNVFYEKGDYERAAIYFVKACDLTEESGNINEKYKVNLKRVRQKIKEEAERREREEVARREQEEAEKIKKEEEAMRREREETAKRKREAERQAREEALRLERARIQSKSLLEEATNIYQQAQALHSLELKLEMYETALSKCGESCASDATEEAFNALNKIFESCLKHYAHDEAEVAIQIVRNYFPSKAGQLEDVLINQQNELWSPDYESIARSQQEQQEQNRTVLTILA